MILDKISYSVYCFTERYGEEPSGIYLGEKEYALLKQYAEFASIQYGTPKNEPSTVYGLKIHRTFNESDLEVF